MATILLVHGAWHGSWCWAKIVSLLQRDGLNAITLDLPGRAGDATPIENLTLDRYARAVWHVAGLQQEPVDCSEDDARRAAAMLVPEAMAPSATPVSGLAVCHEPISSVDRTVRFLRHSRER